MGRIFVASKAASKAGMNRNWQEELTPRNKRRLARKQARADGQMGKSSHQHQDQDKRT
jgi:hypothetical protein